MAIQDDILTQQLSEQIALEEHLCALLREQITEMDPIDFADARELLRTTSEVLERHFTPLNQLLDTLEDAAEGESATNETSAAAANREQQNIRISRMLRDDYSALNLITISNSLLHSTALTVAASDIATVALQHLEHLTPLVVKIGNLVPSVVARELRAEQIAVDASAAETAQRNIHDAWNKVK